MIWDVIRAALADAVIEAPRARWRLAMNRDTLDQARVEVGPLTVHAQPWQPNTMYGVPFDVDDTLPDRTVEARLTIRKYGADVECTEAPGRDTLEAAAPVAAPSTGVPTGDGVQVVDQVVKGRPTFHQYGCPLEGCPGCADRRLYDDDGRTVASLYEQRLLARTLPIMGHTGRTPRFTEPW